MNTDGTNAIATIAGYKYFNFSFEILPMIKDRTKVIRIMIRTIPIALIGFENKGNI